MYVVRAPENQTYQVTTKAFSVKYNGYFEDRYINWWMRRNQFAYFLQGIAGMSQLAYLLFVINIESYKYLENFI